MLLVVDVAGPVTQVKQLQFDTLPGVSRAATIALSKILWKP